MGAIKIAIYGASGHGKVVADIAQSLGYEISFFIDDDESKSSFLGFEVKRFDRDFNSPIALGVGENRVRAKIFQRLKSFNIEILTLIHPTSAISCRAFLDEGVVVMPNATINSCTRVGRGVIINSGSVIEHDCKIGDFVHISPNVALAGAVCVGEFSHIGIGSSVIQAISIGKDCIIGAGSVVIESIKEGSKVVGNPAKKYLKG